MLRRALHQWSPGHYFAAIKNPNPDLIIAFQKKCHYLKFPMVAESPEAMEVVAGEDEEPLFPPVQCANVHVCLLFLVFFLFFLSLFFFAMCKIVDGGSHCLNVYHVNKVETTEFFTWRKVDPFAAREGLSSQHCHDLFTQSNFEQFNG